VEFFLQKSATRVSSAEASMLSKKKFYTTGPQKSAEIPRKKAIGATKNRQEVAARRGNKG
jgi:hypothetical protein